LLSIVTHACTWGFMAGGWCGSPCLADEACVMVRVSSQVIDAFCEALCPIKLSGKKAVGISVLGKSVTQQVPWTATVETPRVSITKKSQKFVANVTATSSALSGISWSEEVSGDLVVSYDVKRQAIVIRTENVIAPITLGPLKMEIDVSADIPELVLSFPVPDIQAVSQSKTISVDIDPEISFENDLVIVTGTPSFRAGRNRSAPAGGSR